MLPLISKNYAQQVELKNNTKLHTLISGYLGSIERNPKSQREIETALLEKELPFFPDISKTESIATNSHQQNFSYKPNALVLDELVDYLIEQTNIGTGVLSDLLEIEPYITRTMRALEKQHAAASLEGISMARTVLELIKQELKNPSLGLDERLMLYHLANTILDVYNLTAQKQFDAVRKNLDLLKFALPAIGCTLSSSADEIRSMCQKNSGAHKAACNVVNLILLKEKPAQ
jgi:hypothetical protein